MIWIYMVWKWKRKFYPLLHINNELQSCLIRLHYLHTRTSILLDDFKTRKTCVKCSIFITFHIVWMTVISKRWNRKCKTFTAHKYLYSNIAYIFIKIGLHFVMFYYCTSLAKGFGFLLIIIVVYSKCIPIWHFVTDYTINWIILYLGSWLDDFLAKDSNLS